MKLKKFTQKDRYGNMRSFEFDITEGQMEVPPMTSSIPMYDHPGEPKGTDTVPAWLTPGEFVVNKEATDIYGPIIKKMNDHGRKIQDMKPKYAEVGMPVPKPNKDTVSEIMFKNKRSRQSDIYNYLKENYPQLTDEAIAGIMGNIGVETGYTYEYTTRQNENTGDQMGPGMGLFQFDEQRKPYKNWLKENDKSDSMESQLDFFVESIYNQGAVPNPSDKSGFFIGSGNAEALQKSLSSNKPAGKIALDIMNKHLKPGVPHADRRSNKAEEIKDLIDNKAFGDPSIYDKYREAGVEVPPSSGGFSFNIPNPFSGIKEKATGIVESVKDFIDPNDIGFKFTKPEKISPFKEGGAVHLDPGGIVYPTLDDKDNVMELIFGSDNNNNNIPKPNPLSSMVVPEDDTTTMSMDMSLPPKPDPIAFGMEDPDLGATLDETPMYGTPTYMSSYDKMVQDELSGSPAYEIPPVFPQIDPDMYDQETGAELLKVGIVPKIKEDDITAEAMSTEQAKYGAGDFGYAQNRSKRATGAIDNEINTNKKKIAKLLDNINKTNDNNKIERFRNQIKELENRQKELEVDRQKSIDFPVDGPSETMQKLMDEAKIKNAIFNAKAVLDNPNATQSEKLAAQKVIDTNQPKLPEPSVNEAETNLSNAASKIDDATVNKISTDLANNASIINTSGANDPKNPNVQKAKDAMKFLFGDLIDAKEIGRAAAVYLGSRALGYDHNSSINYVAKQYLKRVDAKTAQINKYIADNADKFEPTSLQAFKDSRGDYSKLMPKGAKIRNTGEREIWYGKDTGPSGRMAYKFKMKTNEGDIVYWSFDENGKSPIGGGYSKDGTKIRESGPFNEAARKKIPNIKDQMEELLNKHARKQTGKSKTTGALIYEDYTNLTPANSAEEIAFWAQENGISLQRLGPGLKMAVIAAAKNFTNPPDGKAPSKAESLIPYLEEATIKQRLDRMVPGLTQAKVGDEVVQIDTDTLININDRVKSVSLDINSFYNEAANIWNNRGKTNDGKPKGINPDTGKLWRKEYEEAAKKPENEGLTPYALFVIDITNKLSGVN